MQLFVFKSFISFNSSNLCAIHMGSPSGDCAEMEIELANTFLSKCLMSLKSNIDCLSW